MHQVYPTEYIFTTGTNNLSELENCTIYRSNFTRCQHPSGLTNSRQCPPRFFSEYNKNSIKAVHEGQILFRFALPTNLTSMEFCYHGVPVPYHVLTSLISFQLCDSQYTPPFFNYYTVLHFGHWHRTYDFYDSIITRNIVLLFNIPGNSTLRLFEVKFYGTEGNFSTSLTTESTATTGSTRPIDLATTENFTRSSIVIGVMAAAVIILTAILGVTCLVAMVNHRRHSKCIFKHSSKQSTLDSTEEIKLTAIRYIDPMLESNSSYYAASEGNPSQNLQKHDNINFNESDHNYYSVIESATTCTPSGDGNQASLYASIQEKAGSTSEDTHTYSVVNTRKEDSGDMLQEVIGDKCMSSSDTYASVQENESHVQDDSHVYSVVKKKLVKEKETCNEEANTLTPLYAVVDKRKEPAVLEESLTKVNDNREEEVAIEDQGNGCIRMEMKKILV